jgi:hypothetical protein
VRPALALLALGALLGDCGREERPVAGRQSATVPARCDVGGKPGYFVPASSPPVLIGCARLGVSGKRVELSTSPVRIDGEPHTCVDPAYGRGRFIPGICVPDPSRLEIRDASRPRQAVRGHAFVVWGTAPASTISVTARSGGATARAAVFEASPVRAGEPPFSVFVLELPVPAECGRITVVAQGSAASGAGRTRLRRSACAFRGP